MSASVYRLPGAEGRVFGPPPLHRGERTTCPGCGARRKETVWSGYLIYAHGPSLAAESLCATWWARLWRRCKERRSHYHQRCLDCGARWVVGFLEEIE